MLASEHPGAVLGHDPLRPINGAAEEGRIYHRRIIIPDLEPPSPRSCSHRPKGQYPTATNLKTNLVVASGQRAHKAPGLSTLPWGASPW
jgi:hypothetical protein